jgi:uncharacterized membrane protein
MIKDSLVYTLVLLALGTIHFGISFLFEPIYFGKEVILSYFVLLILSVIGNSVFLLEKKSENIEFPQAFMIVTTVQLLGAMSYAAFQRYTLVELVKTNMLQFVVLFMIFLTFQSVYLIKTKAKK